MRRIRVSIVMNGLLAGLLVVVSLLAPWQPAHAQDGPLGQIAFIEEAPHWFIQVLDLATGQTENAGATESGFAWVPDGKALIVAGYKISGNTFAWASLSGWRPTARPANPWPIWISSLTSWATTRRSST